MKRIVVFLLLVVPLYIFAQHCPWDADIVLVVDIHPEGDTKTISRLQVELLDSIGHPVMIEIWDDEQWVEQRSILWQNPSETTNHDIWHTNPRKFHFWFARDQYILFCNYKHAKDNYRLRVTDVDGAENRGLFRTTEVEINKDDFYPLCTNFSNWDDGEEAGFVPGFEPVKVVLTEK